MVRGGPARLHGAASQSAAPLLPGSGLVDSVTNGILNAADHVLHLAFGLVGLALGLQLGIASNLANGYLDRPLGLFRRTLDTVLVHRCLLVVAEGGSSIAPTFQTFAQ